MEAQLSGTLVGWRRGGRYVDRIPPRGTKACRTSRRGQSDHVRDLESLNLATRQGAGVLKVPGGRRLLAAAD